MLHEEGRPCEHLREVGRHLCAGGAAVSSAGQPRTSKRRYGVCFDRVLDGGELRRRFRLPPEAEVHRNDDARYGPDPGLDCSLDPDSVTGLHPSSRKGT